MAQEEKINFICTWRNNHYDITLPSTDTVSQLHEKIYELTKIHPKYQKALNLHTQKGQKPTKDTVLSELTYHKPKHHIVLVGVPEDEIVEVGRGYDPKLAEYDLSVSILNEDIKALENQVINDPNLNDETRRRHRARANLMNANLLNLITTLEKMQDVDAKLKRELMDQIHDLHYLISRVHYYLTVHKK